MRRFDLDMALVTSSKPPAWKRIGLKLKYAKDATDRPDSSSPDQQTSSNLKTDKGISSYYSSDAVRPVKKRKTSREIESHSQSEPGNTGGRALATHSESRGHRDAVLSTESVTVDQLHKSDQTSDQQREPRRKSVTFTSDTKDDDGISAKTLFKQSTTAGQPTSDKSTSQDNTPKSKKGKKRLQSQTQPQNKDTKQTDAHQCLRYLDQFENNKDIWKFNKKRQTELLKHAFDVQTIPTSYNEAILHYIDGLQGNAARIRLIESAESVLKGLAEKQGDLESIESMESAEARRKAYGSALRRQIELVERAGTGLSEYDEDQLEEIRQEVESAKRADEVLALCLQKELRPEQQSQPRSSATTVSTANGQSAASVASQPSSKPARKKRKTRTQGSSSSSDEPESDSEQTRPSRGPRNISEALTSSTTVDPPKPAVPLEKLATGKKVIFDDEMLDEFFPKPKYVETAEKRKRGEGKVYAHLHGNKGVEGESDESGSSSSESDSSEQSDSSSDESDSE